jgi:hypothetical protein
MVIDAISDLLAEAVVPPTPCTRGPSPDRHSADDHPAVLEVLRHLRTSRTACAAPAVVCEDESCRLLTIICAAPCPADLKGDGAVDVLDLLILLDAWGHAEVYDHRSRAGTIAPALPMSSTSAKALAPLCCVLTMMILAPADFAVCTSPAAG